MKKVRILALHLSYGGVEKAIVSIANLLAERYEVEILSVYRMPGPVAFPLDPRVRVRYLLRDVPNREAWKASLRERAPLRFVRESFRAVRILLEKKWAVYRAIRSARDGVFLSTRHEDNLMLSRFGAPGVLKIAQLHHDHRFERRYVRAFARRYGGLDCLVMLTPGLADEVRRMMPAKSRTRVTAIPNFLEHYPEAPSPDGRKQRILSVGRLDAVKGFDRLLRSFSELHAQRPGWQLRIVGEGAERPRLERMIQELGLADAVTLTGRLDAPGVEREMLEASVYAMCSHSEGFGFVLAEAQSCALPLVAYDVRVGPAYLIGEGEDGFLIPDGDEEGFTAALLRLTDDEALRRRMAVRARERSFRFSKEEVAGMWYSVIGE
ncbi:MAG: glycosyltransferase family 4 protein [Oscillospiraceae bacterium]|nr:glycosyltransferase family 4 protein [Oscillospiraceae bacterium]